MLMLLPLNAAHAMIMPLAAVIAYLEEHPGTVTHYDFIAGTSNGVTAGAERLKGVGRNLQTVSG